MIKFFRKIRQRLLSENKFSKYLIYAIGEIFLVVIGILIALEINIKNQESINREYELTMLNEIREGLIRDLDGLKGGLESIDKTRIAVMKLTQAKYEDSFPQDSLEFYFTEVRRSGIGLSLNYSAYESIKSTGLDKISNDALRSSITNLYEVKLKAVDFWINDFIRTRLDLRSELVRQTMDKIIKPDSVNGIAIEYVINHKLIKKNKEFDEILVTAGGYIPIAKRYVDFATREIIAQIKEIDAELNKK